MSLFAVFLSTGLHVKETEDNEAVVSTVKDLHKLITNKYLAAVQGWVQVSKDTLWVEDGTQDE